MYSRNWELPVVSFLIPVRAGDYREEIARSSSQGDIANSPLILVSVLPLSSLYPIRWPWYYEAGASAYNVMLESELLDLHAGIVRPLDMTMIKSILRLNFDSLPLLIIPIGQ